MADFNTKGMQVGALSMLQASLHHNGRCTVVHKHVEQKQYVLLSIRMFLLLSQEQPCLLYGIQEQGEAHLLLTRDLVLPQDLDRCKINLFLPVYRADLGGGRGHALGNALQLCFAEAQVVAQAQPVQISLQPADLPRQLVTLQLLQQPHRVQHWS